MQKKATLGIQESVKDMVEQKRLFAALHESEHRYRQLVQGLPAAVYTCDREGRIMLYNKAAIALWGREPQIGKDLWCGSWRIYQTDGKPLPLDTCPMAIALKEGRPVYGEEIVVERPDGERRNVLPHPEPIFDAAGEIIGAVNMLVDITDHKIIAQKLRESEERFRTMADQAPIIIWMSDEKSNSIYQNSRWWEFVGMHAEKASGTGWADFIHPEDKELAYEEWLQAFENRQPYNTKFRYRNAKGEYRIVVANCTPRVSEQGEFMGYIGILNDITLEENAKVWLENLVEERTRELVIANGELERSNQELEQFAYVASHDLQEPLRKIQAFSNLLQRDSREILNENCLMYLDKISGSASRLSALIDDLLNFSRITRQGTLFAEIDLNEVLEKVKNDFELLISRKKAVIKLIHCKHLPTIEGVPLQINQLFNNLINNSLKFSSKHRPPNITISCRKLEELETASYSDQYKNIPHYEIVIKDNGIGFEAEYAEQIFMIFQRLHDQYTFAGSGIGLALCRKIVVNHHGKIHAEGMKGKGSSFHVILPERQV